MDRGGVAVEEDAERGGLDASEAAITSASLGSAITLMLPARPGRFAPLADATSRPR